MRFDADGRPTTEHTPKQVQRGCLPRLTSTFLAAMLGTGMGLTFYGLGTLEGETGRSGIGDPTLPPTPLPTATPAPTSTPGLPVVLIATMTPSPTATSDPNPPTPFVRPTATPYPACGPHLEAGRVCMMPEPAPTTQAVPTP